MYDLNHIGGGSSSGLFPLLSFTVTCVQTHQAGIKNMHLLNNYTQIEKTTAVKITVNCPL